MTSEPNTKVTSINILLFRESFVQNMTIITIIMKLDLRTIS